MAPSSSHYPRSTDASESDSDNGLLTHGSDIVIILLLVCALVFALEMVRGKVAAARRARSLPRAPRSGSSGGGGLPVEEEPSARRRKRARAPPAWYEVCVAGEGDSEGEWNALKPLAYRSMHAPSRVAQDCMISTRVGCVPVFVKTHSATPSASSTSSAPSPFSESSSDTEMSDMTQSPSRATSGEVVVLVAMPRPGTTHAECKEETKQLELGVARWPVPVDG